MAGYGQQDGLADRLAEWARRLSTDKTLPWIGTGLIADLNAAAAAVRGEQSGEMLCRIEYRALSYTPGEMPAGSSALQPPPAIDPATLALFE